MASPRIRTIAAIVCENDAPAATPVAATANTPKPSASTPKPSASPGTSAPAEAAHSDPGDFTISAETEAKPAYTPAVSGLIAKTKDWSQNLYAGLAQFRLPAVDNALSGGE